MDHDIAIKNETPPNYSDICNALGVPPKGTVFTYGKTIYNPDNVQIPYFIIEHEKVHMEQQKWNEADAAFWWAQYLSDPAFRLEAELEGYSEQCAVMWNNERDRNKRARILWNIASALCSPTYGNLLSHSDAMKEIKNQLVY